MTLLALLALGSGVLRADEKPTLAQEQAKFRKADAELNAAYKIALTELDKAGATRLREDERRWLEFRDSRAESMHWFNTSQEVEDPKSTIDYWEAMVSFTEERTDFLRIYSGNMCPVASRGDTPIATARIWIWKKPRRE